MPSFSDNMAQRLLLSWAQPSLGPYLVVPAGYEAQHVRRAEPRCAPPAAASAKAPAALRPCGT